MESHLVGTAEASFPKHVYFTAGGTLILGFAEVLEMSRVLAWTKHDLKFKLVDSYNFHRTIPTFQNDTVFDS